MSILLAEQTQLTNYINRMVSYFLDIKKYFDDFDNKEKEESKRINFLLSKKKDIFQKFDLFFCELWKMVNGVDPKIYKAYQKYAMDRMHPYIVEDIEVNRHIRSKPFGYGGDFITMNYIYDYYSNNYLGRTTYQKLINHYTCTRDVAYSNIVRKDYIKSKITEVVNICSGDCRILSIGSGSARELIELLKEKKINQKVKFYCLDFEAQAIEYIKNDLSKVSYDKSKVVIDFIKTDLINLVKNNNKKFDLSSMNLIYISGVFDYLSERLCTRITSRVFSWLNAKGVLIIANMSLENAQHRGYYEFLGDWVMIHRKKKELINWLKSIREKSDYELFNIPHCESYHFVKIRPK